MLYKKSNSVIERSSDCSNKESNKISIVKLPKTYSIIFAGLYLLFHLPIIGYIGTNNYSKKEMIVFFITVMFICLIFFISTLNWKITYDSNGFSYRTSFRRTLNYKYSDIEKIKRTKSDMVLLKTAKRWLIIDPYAVGKDNFMKMIK